MKFGLELSWKVENFFGVIFGVWKEIKYGGKFSLFISVKIDVEFLK